MLQKWHAPKNKSQLTAIWHRHKPSWHDLWSQRSQVLRGLIIMLRKWHHMLRKLHYMLQKSHHILRTVCCGLVFNCWLYGCQFDIKRPDHVACLYVHYAFTSYQPRRDSFNIKETSGTYMSVLFISIIVQTMLGTPCILKSYASLRHRQITTPVI